MKQYGYGLILAWVAILCMGVSPASAQSKVAPAGPHLAPWPDHIAYTKTFAYPPEKAPDPNLTPEQKGALEFLAKMKSRIVQIDVEKTNEIFHAFYKYDNGRTTEVWGKGTMRFYVDSARPNYITVWSPEISREVVKDATDVGELSWAGADCYVGEQTIRGEGCYLYRKNERAVWISKVSRLPLRYDGPDVKEEFLYKGEPRNDLVLPEIYTKRAKEVMDGWTGRLR